MFHSRQLSNLIIIPDSDVPLDCLLLSVVTSGKQNEESNLVNLLGKKNCNL